MATVCSLTRISPLTASFCSLCIAKNNFSEDGRLRVCLLFCAKKDGDCSPPCISVIPQKARMTQANILPPRKMPPPSTLYKSGRIGQSHILIKGATISKPVFALDNRRATLQGEISPKAHVDKRVTSPGIIVTIGCKIARCRRKFHKLALIFHWTLASLF